MEIRSRTGQYPVGGDFGDRPSFKLVTGVSTGSLIAPFAFLGPQYDETLKRFYTTIIEANTPITREDTPIHPSDHEAPEPGPPLGPSPRSWVALPRLMLPSII